MDNILSGARLMIFLIEDDALNNVPSKPDHMTSYRILSLMDVSGFGCFESFSEEMPPSPPLYAAGLS